MLVFFRDRGERGVLADVMSVNVLNGNERVLFNGSGFKVSPHRWRQYGPWSPDGRRVALVVQDAKRKNRAGVFVVDLASGRLRRLLADANGVSWSPDGRQIAAVGSIRGRSGLIVADASGRKPPRLLVRSKSIFRVYSAWSPDGLLIAYRSIIRPPDQDMENGLNGLSVADARGKNPPRLIVRVEDTPGVAWSPDGSEIAYVRVAGKYSCCEIHLVRRDGRGDRRVAGHAGSVVQALDPTWSPDGRQIAYCLCGQGRLRLHVVDADGTRDRTLTDPSIYVSDSDPTWSPDSSQIATDRTREKTIHDIDHTIVVLQADGAGERTVATDASSPVWSPDGETIAYIGVDATGAHLYVVAAAGNDKRQLTNAPSQDFGQKWLPIARASH